ncbi:MAG: tRNA (adenosine(37)-N6)-threonylcarbamoyltransferase complex dimerization subunit type 1 TsaB [Nitrospiria bacterium]
MIILSVETSTPMGSVAILENGGLLGEYLVFHEAHHSRVVMKMIDDLLKSCRLTLPDIDLFAVSVGPGSFTGLRVGIATVKGFSTALGKPVAGIPTLEAFAGRVPYTPYPILPVIPARKHEGYTALYQYEDFNKLILLKPARVIPLESLLEEIETPTHLLGNFSPELIEKSSNKNIIFSPLFKYPSATTVGLTAYRKRDFAIKENAEMILPAYPPEKVQTHGLYL